MADTTVTTGKTIDNLDPIEETAEEKATFIAGAVLPIRGTLNGTTKTFKVTGSDLTIPAEQVQADWNQTTTTAKDYVKNKPHFNTGLKVTNEAGYDNVELHINSNKPGLLINNQDGLGIETDDTLGPNSEYSFKLGVTHPVPDPGTNAHRGHVLTVDNSDEIVWAAPQGGGGIPDPSSVTNGYVLTVSNGAATWAAPGGGGSSNVEQISMICLKNQSTAGQTVIQSVSMTPKQALQSYNSGKTLILNVIVKTNLSSDEIWEQYTYPLSYLGYGWDEEEEENRYYILYFDYISALEGTGADLWHGVKGKLDTTDGTWEISSPSDN